MHIKTEQPSILVVGGAGYIGAHMVWLLQHHGYGVTVFDNLSKGHRKAVRNAPLIVGDIRNKSHLASLFETKHFDAVMHFASLIEVAESCRYPLRYYENNVLGSINLLQTMLEHHIHLLIFSSSAAVYGEPLPKNNPISETHPLNPINPYGKSKKMVEEIILDLAESAGLAYMVLRYFNAAGAHPEGLLGEQHLPESHLIPLVLHAALNNQTIALFGEDYPTTDGTCIRDYIHVMDLCHAHLLALEQLFSGHKNKIYNLGSGCGYSVQEVLHCAAGVTQRSLKIHKAARRIGDPAILLADSSRARAELGWIPQFSDLKTILFHAWQYVLQASPSSPA